MFTFVVIFYSQFNLFLTNCFYQPLQLGGLGSDLVTGGNDKNAIYMGAAIASLASTVIVKTSPETMRLVRIPQGDIHTFSLLEPLQIMH